MLEQQSQDIKIESQEIPPPQLNKKNLKKEKSLLLKEQSKYLPLILLNFNISENNNKLEEMLSDLEIFREQYNENQEKNILNSDADNLGNSTQLLIYNALEKHLIEISYIDNKDIRSNRINSLYLWYKERNKIREDLKRINVKSYKELDEISEEELLKHKEEEKNEQNEQNEKKEENEEKEENRNEENEQTEQKIENNKILGKKKFTFKKLNPRNEELINKKMLDEYQRKLLSKSISESKLKLKTRNDKNNQSENTFEKTTESAILTKTMSVIPSQDFWVGDYSTFYSYKNGTNTTTIRNNHNFSGNETNYRDQVKGGEHENYFFPKYNKEIGLYFPPLNRETKFSYSYNRPQYNYSTMIIENKIKDNKMKFLIEKRGEEEIKHHLDQFGMKRAKFKEEMNNKYELKSVINMYVNSNNLNSPLLEKYKIKGNSSQKKNPVHNIDFNQTMNQPLIKFTIGESSLNKNIEDKSKYQKSQKAFEDFEKLLNDNRIETISQRESDEDNEKNNLKKSKKYSKSLSTKNFAGKKLFRGINDKIKINEVKNIDNNSKILLETNKLNKIKLKIKLPKEKIQSHLISLQKKSDKITSDAIGKLISNNSLYKERQTYEKLCKVNINTKLHEKSIDNKSLYSISEDESGYHNFCLSMYDQGNLRKINDNNSNINKYYGYNNLNRKNLKDSKIHFNKLHRTFHLFKDNLLNLRRTMSDWKTGEYMNLVNEIKKNNKKGTKERDRDREDREKMFRNNSYGFINIRIKKQNSLLNAMINPKDEFSYSRYFLPRTGSMLLSRMEEPKNKKKK